MTLEKKIEYIWDYYKIHIFIGILAVLAIIWGIHHAFTYVDYKFYGMVINSEQYDEEAFEHLQDDIGMKKHEGFSFTGGLYTDETAGFSPYGNRLTLMIMTNQIDFAFADEEGLKYLQGCGFVQDFTDISDSPVQDYFGLDDNTKYLVFVGLSGNEQFMDNFKSLIEKIDSGEIKGE